MRTPLIDVLMPYRPNSTHRRRIFEAMTVAWTAVDFPVHLIVGYDGDETTRTPFNLAKAANDAFRASTADVVLLHGVDHIPPDPGRLAWALDQLQEHPWLGLYAGTRALTRESTSQVLQDVKHGRVPLMPGRYSHRAAAPVCTGIMAFRRDAWERLGGMDERFYGWGCEDTALRLAATHIFGPPPIPGGQLTTLWHAPSPRDRFDANAAMLGEYQAAAAAGRMHEYLQDRGTFL